jgi:CubicO group peptidase (beta-lactamase class C family)
MKHLAAIITMLLVTGFANSIIAQEILNDKRLAGLDSTVNRALTSLHAAGVAVAVVEKNKIIYTAGFGYRDYEKKLPMTPNTILAIGSCTKAFTASLLGILAGEEKLDLEKPVHHYLPRLKFHNDYLTNHVTALDMMSHRTGLPRHDYAWYGARNISRDSFFNRIQYLEPSAELRQKWQYNNFMYMAQGVLAQELTGKTWEENLRERIFRPLNMNSTFFTIPELEKNPDHAIGYGNKKDSIIRRPYRPLDAIGPAGSINSNVKDMANWAILWINGGKLNNKEIIPSNYIRKATSSQMPMSAGFPDAKTPDVFFANYGLGWMLASYKGHYRVEHGGNIDGFSASVCIMPTDSIGIIVLTNQDGSSVTSVVRNTILDKLLNLNPTDWTSRILQANMAAAANEDESEEADSLAGKTNTKPSHALADYAGNYTNPGYGTIVITEDKGKLKLVYNSHHLVLKHYHYDVFNATSEDASTEGISVKMRFSINYKGDIESVASGDFEPSVKEIVFKRAVTEITVKKEQLQKYAGEYDLSGTEVKFYLKNDKLYAFLEGQPEYELIPTKKDAFSIKILEGYDIIFTVNDKDQVTEAMFAQPNGNFKAIRKAFMKKEDIKPIKVKKETLSGYTGEYDLNGTTVKIYIKEQNILMASVPGQPDYELVPVAKDEFVLKVRSSYKVTFTMNEQGTSTALSFIQPNGTFNAKRK